MSTSRFRKFLPAVVLATAIATGFGFSVATGPANAAPVEYGAFCSVGGPAPTQTNFGSVYMWKLTGGTRLDAGQFCEWGRTKLIMQTNGNLQVLDELGNVGWSSATRGRGDHAIFQTDGNFVIYSSANKAVWSSYTASTTPLFLAVQIDGNVVIYDASWNVYWVTDTVHSGTGGIPPVETPTPTVTSGAS
jgi:hypothetical protein